MIKDEDLADRLTETLILLKPNNVPLTDGIWGEKFKSDRLFLETSRVEIQIIA